MKKKGFLGALTGVDIALVAGLSLVIGFLFTYWYNLYKLLDGFGPFMSVFLYGFWFLGGIIPAYIIRKPGAAFLGEFLAAHVEMLTGSPYGVWLSLYGATQGLASEMAFALFGYKKWGYLQMALAGFFPAIVAFIIDYLRYNYGDLAMSAQIGLGAGMLVSGALFGILGKVIVDAIARTGALNNFAVGREQG